MAELPDRHLGTHGTFVLSKESNLLQPKPEQATGELAPVNSRPATGSGAASPLTEPWVIVAVEDLEDLVRLFAEATSKARPLNEETIRKRTAASQQAAEIQRLPGPSIEITGSNGKFIVVSDLAQFSPDLVPPEIKSIQLFSYKQGGYAPAHGVQIRMTNINGSDAQNSIGSGRPKSVRNVWGARRLGYKARAAPHVRTRGNKGL